MTDTSRTDELRAEIDSLKMKTSGNKDKTFASVGAGLMVVGIVIAIIAFITAGGQNSGNLSIDNLEQNESIILAITGLAVTIAGAAVFLRYSLAIFLRVWLLRQLYEGQANTAKLVAELKD